MVLPCDSYAPPPPVAVDTEKRVKEGGDANLASISRND